MPLLFLAMPSASAAGNLQQQQQQQQDLGQELQPLLITSSIQMHLVMPGEQLTTGTVSHGSSSSSSSSTTTVKGTAALAAAAGVWSPAGLGQEVRRPLDVESRVAVARAAAEQSVTGSSAEAAMAAAERAVRTGGPCQASKLSWFC